MTPRRKKLLHALGLLVFAVVLVVSLLKTPPDLRRLDAQWLAFSAMLATVAIAIQVAQTTIFLRSQSFASNWTWATWFTAEKAWVNSVFPAKIGTAGAIVYLKSALGMEWSRYLRFMLLCAGLATAASAAGMLALLWPGPAGTLGALAAYAICALPLRFLYHLRVRHFLVLACLGLGNLIALTLGVGACLLGLGFDGSFSDIAPVGVLLNLLSVVSVTPGNFGFREAILTLASPLLALDFGAVVQASTCYVFLRLLIALVTATALRSHASAKLD